MTGAFRTPASLLQEYCVHRKITPVYEMDDDRLPTNLKTFICKVTCDEYTATGDGRSKKEAKHAAAKKMLQLIETLCEPLQNTNAVTVPSPYENKVKEDSVGPLIDFCSEYGIAPPEYVHTRAEGPPHATMFTFRCTVGSFQTEAIDRTKQQAKQLAAMYMLNRLKKMVDSRIKIELPEITFIDSAQEPDYRTASVLLNNGSFSDFKKILAGNLTHPLSSDFVQFEGLFRQNPEVHEQFRSAICNDKNEDPLTTLKAILDEADYKYSLIPIESNCNVCSIILNIDCSPNLYIMETGNTYVECCHNVAVKTLKYFKILCSNKEPCFENFEEEPCCENPEEEGCSENPEEDIDFESLINVKKKTF